MTGKRVDRGEGHRVLSPVSGIVPTNRPKVFRAAVTPTPAMAVVESEMRLHIFIRVLLGNPSLQELREALHRRFREDSGWSWKVERAGKNCYVANCGSQERLKRVLQTDCMNWGEVVITIRQWSLDIGTWKNEDWPTVWVRIHDLPQPCWVRSGLTEILRDVAIIETVDEATSQRSRKDFARVRVRCQDVGSLPSSILVDFWDRVYEVRLEVESDQKQVQFVSPPLARHISRDRDQSRESSEAEEEEGDEQQGGQGVRARDTRDSLGSQSEESGRKKGGEEPVVVENKVMEFLKDLMGTVGGDPIELRAILTGAASSLGISEQVVGEAPPHEHATTEVASDAFPILEETAALDSECDLGQHARKESDDRRLREDGQGEEGKAEEVSEEDEETWSVELNKIYPGVSGDKSQGQGGY